MTSRYVNQGSERFTPRSGKDRFHDLIEAATSVFLDLGYRRTQIAHVAERMGVAKGAVYLYVESKEALFHAVVRQADRRERIALLDTLPFPTPPPGATLEGLRKRLAGAILPALTEALSRRRVVDVRAELEAILHELYALLSSHRVGIRLLDRCASCSASREVGNPAHEHANRSSPMPPLSPTSPSRRHDLDALRVFGCYLLFLFPVAMVFNPAPFCHVGNAESSMAFLVLCGFISLWHMPLLLLLAGWSAAASIRSRGWRGFLRERGE